MLSGNTSTLSNVYGTQQCRGKTKRGSRCQRNGNWAQGTCHSHCNQLIFLPILDTRKIDVTFVHQLQKPKCKTVKKDQFEVSRVGIHWLFLLPPEIVTCILEFLCPSYIVVLFQNHLESPIFANYFRHCRKVKKMKSYLEMMYWRIDFQKPEGFLFLRKKYVKYQEKKHTSECKGCLGAKRFAANTIT